MVTRMVAPESATLGKGTLSIAGMRELAGGVFAMGSQHFYPEEAPVRPVRVDSFWIDEAPVTNRDFALFVAATCHRTLAEIAPDPADYPGMPIEMAQPGSLVFERTAGPVDLEDFTRWWHFKFGADWRHPLGSDSSIDDLLDHPVVHIAYGDAEAYAVWAGKSQMLANYWQGAFPFANQLLDGWERTSPIGTYPPNGNGLFDMIGNVWEWTSDWWSLPTIEKKKFKGACCVPANPRGGRERDSLDPCAPHVQIGRKVLKGGSHLCAPNYCQRYRPAARHAQPVDSSTSHIGFRCVLREKDRQ
jgi:sulfatase modifying factor 1